METKWPKIQTSQQRVAVASLFDRVEISRSLEPFCRDTADKPESKTDGDFELLAKCRRHGYEIRYLIVATKYEEPLFLLKHWIEKEVGINNEPK